MAYTVADIHKAAKQAHIYVTPHRGVSLLVHQVYSDCIVTVDIAGGNHVFNFADMIANGETPNFQKLVPIKVEHAESEDWIEP